MTKLSEQERHSIEHARYQAGRATPEDPECCFDYELVKTLIGIVDRLAAQPQSPRKPASVQRGEPTEEELATAFQFALEKPSTSYIQRKMGIGYNHASAIMETFEDEGVISQPSTSGVRTILAVTRPDRKSET